MLFKSLALVAAATVAVAQRPTNTSICDYYTTALLTNNTAANQMTLLTLIVNRAVIGNTSATTTGIAVPGILNPAGKYNGTAVNLVPYFSGALKSTNVNGVATAKNFLDGGGATPIAAGMPASDTTSNQYFLLTHLYEFFGGLLGCSELGMPGYPAYAGAASMYEVHKFMVLDPNEMAYFVTQVGLSAASFGAAAADVTAAGNAIVALFDNRCGPETTIFPAQGAALQSICTDPTCPLATNSSCTDQATIAAPANASSTSSSASGTATSGTSTGTATGTASPSSTSKPASAVKDAASIMVLAGAVGAGVFALL